MPSVTIGFTPRERFSLAAGSLQRIFDCTHIPFNLIVVDCNIPKRYRQEMDEVLRGRENVKILCKDQYLLPNQSRNLVIAEATDEYLCLTENDTLVEDDWLSRLIAACEDYPADVAVPIIFEGRLGSREVHFDTQLGHIRPIQGSDGVRLEILPRTTPLELDIGADRRQVDFVEQHCVLFRRKVFDRIGPYDGELGFKDEADLSLALYHAKARIVFEPNSAVYFVPPFPLRADEAEYFSMIWDLELARKTLERIQKKWNLVNLPRDIAFVKSRLLMGSLHLVREELKTVIPEGEMLILVDEDRWRNTEILDGFRTIPFLERNGEYWGPPSDDEVAISELERLRKCGAAAIVFGMWTFWWLEHYAGLHLHLVSNYRCLLRNERVVVFDLQK